jgi:predicted RNase H-like nuclease (RuvC/YqgF family)
MELIEKAKKFDEMQTELIEKDKKIEELQKEMIMFREGDFKKAKLLNQKEAEIEQLKNKVAEQQKEIEGFKTFLQQTSDIDKRADDLIKAQAEKIEHLKEVIKKYDIALDNEKNSQTEK